MFFGDKNNNILFLIEKKRIKYNFNIFEIRDEFYEYIYIFFCGVRVYVGNSVRCF